MHERNTLAFAQDEEHRKITLSPQQNAWVKDVRLVYYPPHVKMQKHAHSTAQFSTLLCGQASQDCNRASLHHHQGIAEFKPSDFQHSNLIGPDGAVYLSMNIDADHEAFRQEFGRVDWNLSEIKHAQNSWQHVYRLLFDPVKGVDVDLEELILGLLCTAMPYAGQVRQAPSWLRQAEQALHDSMLNVEQIADSVGVHRVHLCRVFQAHFGLSVSGYRQRLSIQRSVAALLQDESDIVMASNEAGFADQSHFTRVLKKHFGITPLRLKTLFNA